VGRAHDDPSVIQILVVKMLNVNLGLTIMGVQDQSVPVLVDTVEMLLSVVDEENVSVIVSVQVIVHVLTTFARIHAKDQQHHVASMLNVGL